jgi:lipoate---protein ligase
MLFFFYTNSSCVVLGRNQNPWCECNPFLLYENDIELVRRYSGGGAVYHDLGNLNVSILMNQAKWYPEMFMTKIVDYFAQWNLSIQIGQRNDLYLGKQKVSGSAFYYHKDWKLIHFTLLFHSDLTRLQLTLVPYSNSISTNATCSHRASVTNLFTTDEIMNAYKAKEGFIYEFPRMFGIVEAYPFPKTTNQVDEFNEKYAQLCSFPWIFGKTPFFTFEKYPIDPKQWVTLQDIPSFLLKSI